jgi:hypothetical protein
MADRAADNNTGDAPARTGATDPPDPAERAPEAAPVSDTVALAAPGNVACADGSNRANPFDAVPFFGTACVKGTTLSFGAAGIAT